MSPPVISASSLWRFGTIVSWNSLILRFSSRPMTSTSRVELFRERGARRPCRDPESEAVVGSVPGGGTNETANRNDWEGPTGYGVRAIHRGRRGRGSADGVGRGGRAGRPGSVRGAARRRRLTTPPVAVRAGAGRPRPVRERR